MKKIRIGIIDGNPGWELLLLQEGIPFCHRDDEGIFDDCSLLVAGDLTAAQDIEPIKKFLSAGKALLCSAVVAEALGGVTCRRRLLKSVLPAEGSRFAGIGLTDLYLNGRIFPGAQELADERGLPTTFFGEMHGGCIVVFPFDPAAAMADRRTIAKSFYADRRRLPYEQVPLVAKSELRKVVARALEALHLATGLPYVHRWYYPGNSSSVALFRIDTDFAQESDLRDLADLSLTARLPFSWFVDVKSQLPHIGFYKTLDRQEIALHCYRHIRYRNPGEAAADIDAGMKILGRHGFAVTGCALPYGQWSIEIGKMLEQRAFRYSSEFSYDVDNLPSYPDLGYHRSRLLQVPVHPISIGNLRRQGFPEGEMIRYFDALLEMKISRREPAFLYHHPKNRGRAVLEKVFEHLRRSRLELMTMSDYADWWNERTDDRLTLTLDAGLLHVSGLSGQSNALLRIVNEKGEEAFVAPSGPVKLGSLAWEAVRQPAPNPADLRRVRRYNPWPLIQNVEDAVSGLFRSA